MVLYIYENSITRKGDNDSNPHFLKNKINKEYVDHKILWFTY